VRHYTVYIDEAGDEGIGKLASGVTGGQSRWLIIGACIVSRENDLLLPSLRDSILSRFPKKQKRDLHFRDLKHEQKVVTCQEIARFKLGACLSLSHKVTIPGSKWENIFKQKGYLYNYLIRWLLERITAACKHKHFSEPCSIKIVFSRRGGTNYQTMIEYFQNLKEGNEVVRPVRKIDWNMIDFNKINVENHSKWAGLQIADCITSAFFSALEPNIYGNYEPSYAMLLQNRLLKTNGSCINSGLTAVPALHKSGLNDHQNYFFRHIKRRAPGL
jgi:hypothetical protein